MVLTLPTGSFKNLDKVRPATEGWTVITLMPLCEALLAVCKALLAVCEALLAVWEALLAVYILHSPLVSCAEDEEASRKRNHRCRMKKPSTYRYNDDSVYIVEVV